MDRAPGGTNAHIYLGFSVDVRISRGPVPSQKGPMNWKSIRLELGRTRDFPNGSASRAYLMRVPLADDGTIDAEAIERLPEQATVRRMWPSQPDQSGHLIRRGERWAFLAGRSGKQSVLVSEMDPEPISQGALLTLRENGEALPFRVARLCDLS